jgi:hypothetical protein
MVPGYLLAPQLRECKAEQSTSATFAAAIAICYCFSEQRNGLDLEKRADEALNAFRGDGQSAHLKGQGTEP